MSGAVMPVFGPIVGVIMGDEILPLSPFELRLNF